MPGIGGIGTGSSFTENLTALARYQVNLRTIHKIKNPDTSIELFGHKLALPVLAAPITGMETNLAGGMDEKEYANAILDGCLECGTLGMVGDGASPKKYLIGLEAIKNHGGLGIPIFKPREFNLDIIKRFKAAEDAGALAVGVDIDAASFKTMSLKGQAVGPKTIDELQELKTYLKVPFILKGIMNAYGCDFELLVNVNKKNPIDSEMLSRAEIKRRDAFGPSYLSFEKIKTSFFKFFIHFKIRFS